MTCRRVILATLLAGCGLMPSTAIAQANESVAASGSLALSSEHVARGISYSNEKPSIAGRFLLTKGDLELAGSAISVSGGTATVELALEARLVRRLGDVELRLAVERTEYPGATPNIDYWELGASLRRQWKRTTVDLGTRISPDDSGGAHYSYVEASRTISETETVKITLRFRIGRRTYFDRQQAGQPNYWHGMSAIALQKGPLTYEIAVHDTDLPPGTFFPSGARAAARVVVNF